MRLCRTRLRKRTFASLLALGALFTGLLQFTSLDMDDSAANPPDTHAHSHRHLISRGKMRVRVDQWEEQMMARELQEPPRQQLREEETDPVDDQYADVEQKRPAQNYKFKFEPIAKPYRARNERRRQGVAGVVADGGVGGGTYPFRSEEEHKDEKGDDMYQKDAEKGDPLTGHGMISTEEDDDYMNPREATMRHKARQREIEKDTFYNFRNKEIADAGQETGTLRVLRKNVESADFLRAFVDKRRKKVLISEEVNGKKQDKWQGSEPDRIRAIVEEKKQVTQPDKDAEPTAAAPGREQRKNPYETAGTRNDNSMLVRNEQNLHLLKNKGDSQGPIDIDTAEDHNMRKKLVELKVDKTNELVQPRRPEHQNSPKETKTLLNRIPDKQRRDAEAGGLKKVELKGLRRIEKDLGNAKLTVPGQDIGNIDQQSVRGKTVLLDKRRSQIGETKRAEHARQNNRDQVERNGPNPERRAKSGINLPKYGVPVGQQNAEPKLGPPVAVQRKDPKQNPKKLQPPNRLKPIDEPQDQKQSHTAEPNINKEPKKEKGREQLPAARETQDAGRVPPDEMSGRLKEFETLYMKKLREKGCTEFGTERARYRLRDVVMDAVKATTPPRADDVTLTTHAPFTQTRSLLSLVARWKGPVVAAVFVERTHYLPYVRALRAVRTLRARKDVSVHVVRSRGQDEVYPTRFMQSVALSGVHTDFTFLVDVDLVPHVEFRRRLIHTLSTGALQQKQVLVVPAFEAFSNETSVPHSKTDLRTLWRSGDVGPYLLDFLPPAHLPTRYDKWIDAVNPYDVTYLEGFSPNLVARSGELPRFDANVTGEWRARSGPAFLLHQLGFRFTVVPDTFLVHLPHRSELRPGAKFKRCASTVKRLFKNSYLSKVLRKTIVVRLEKALQGRRGDV